MEQAHISMHGARWLIHRNAVSKDFFDSAIGKQLAPLEPEGVQRLLLAMEAISPALPELRASLANFNSTSSFQEFSYHAMMLPHGYIGVQLVCVNMSFRLLWSNPAWEALGFDASAELGAIPSRLKEAISHVPQMAWTQEGFDVKKSGSLTKIHGGWLSTIAYTVGNWLAGPTE